MEMTFCIDEISDIIKQQFKNLLQEYSIFIFKGQLGAGKTTMIKEILLSCGVKQVVTSPTFNYVNSYKNAQNQIFNHFDLYRITSEGQFFDLGFDEYFYRKNEWCFIEWPEIIEHLLKDPDLCKRVCVVELEHVSDDEFKRYLRVNSLV